VQRLVVFLNEYTLTELKLWLPEKTWCPVFSRIHIQRGTARGSRFRRLYQRQRNWSGRLAYSVVARHNGLRSAATQSATQELLAGKMQE
jgi:hypothetical protein